MKHLHSQGTEVEEDSRWQQSDRSTGGADTVPGDLDRWTLGCEGSRVIFSKSSYSEADVGRIIAFLT